jgi:hypothetical protein
MSIGLALRPGEAARRAKTSSSSEDCLNCLEITDQRLGA